MFDIELLLNRLTKELTLLFIGRSHHCIDDDVVDHHHHQFYTTYSTQYHYK